MPKKLKFKPVHRGLQQMYLNKASLKIFMKALENPPPPTAEMIALWKEVKEWFN